MTLLHPSHVIAFDRPTGNGLPVDEDTIDPETAALIAQLALRDLEEIYMPIKGKSSMDTPLSDEEYTFRMQSESFREWLAIAEDAMYAKSLGGALTADMKYIEAQRVAEAAAEQDRRAAEMLQRGEPLPPITPAQRRMEDPTFILCPEPTPVVPAYPTMEPLASLGKQPEIIVSRAELMEFNGEVYDSPTVVPSMTEFDDMIPEYSDFTSSWKAEPMESVTPSRPGPSVLGTRMVQCTICADELRFDKALHTPCDHYYCSECISSYASASMHDEELSPVRCCLQPILATEFTPFLTPDLRASFVARQTEFSVPQNHRLYCVNKTCSAFLGSSEGSEETDTAVVCSACGTATCPHCKHAEHVGEECSASEAVVHLRTLAGKEGWQTCPGCEWLVEKSEGCNHMTCRCNTQFCYRCAVEWSKCKCPK